MNSMNTNNAIKREAFNVILVIVVTCIDNERENLNPVQKENANLPQQPVIQYKQS